MDILTLTQAVLVAKNVHGNMKQAVEHNKLGRKEQARKFALAALDDLDDATRLMKTYPTISRYVRQSVASLRLLAGDLRLDLSDYELGEDGEEIPVYSVSDDDDGWDDDWDDEDEDDDDDELLLEFEEEEEDEDDEDDDEVEDHEDGEVAEVELFIPEDDSWPPRKKKRFWRR